jgi:hypothetical protein
VTGAALWRNLIPVGGGKRLGFSFGGVMLVAMLLLAYASLVGSAAATARTSALERPDSSATPTTRFSGGGITFRYPAGWTAETDPAFTFSFTTLIVYLSDERMGSPCLVTTTATTLMKTCGAPLSRLSAGSVLASWWEHGRPDWTFKRDARGMPLRVGGHRAKLRVTRVSCGVGADVRVDVIVDRPANPDNWYEFSACIRGPGIQHRERQVMALLKTVQFGRLSAQTDLMDARPGAIALGLTAAAPRRSH